MVKKAAELDPPRSLEFIKGLSLSGWKLTGALSGYVQSVGEGGNWRQVIEDLSYFEGHRGDDGKPLDLSKTTKLMIAASWVREDFEEGMTWYAQETVRDYNNPGDVTEVASILGRLPEDESHRAIEWLQDAKGQPNWNDDLIMKYGMMQVRRTPDANANQLVAMMSREEDRYELVKNYIGSDDPSHPVSLRHSPEDLNRLIESANLSASNSARLEAVVADGVWQAR